jgi:hypothetical protein
MHGAQDRVTKYGFDLGMSEDDQIWAKPELTVMTRARTDRIRAVSRRRGVRPRVHGGVDVGTSAARAVTYPRPAEDKKLDEVGRALSSSALITGRARRGTSPMGPDVVRWREAEACIRADPASSADRRGRQAFLGHVRPTARSDVAAAIVPWDHKATQVTLPVHPLKESP